MDETFNFLTELQGKLMTICELSNTLTPIIDYDILDYESEDVFIDNESVTVSKNDIEYNIFLKIVALNEYKRIDTIIFIQSHNLQEYIDRKSTRLNSSH